MSDVTTGATIESGLQEQRLFPPPQALSDSARIGSLEAYRALCSKAEADPDGFWGDLARRELHWFEPFHTVLDWTNPPFARWFEGGTTNLSFNCLDRHLEGPRAEKTALIWEGEPGDTRRFTYRQLHAEVCKAANALKALGIGKGDLVALYMPMVPEAAIAMLACARIGAPHSVVFGGFSADALRDRLIDGEVKAVITADGGFRKDKPVPLKPAVDEALAGNGGAPSARASSTAGLRATGLSLRKPPSAVITALAAPSFSRSRRASAEKPPNTTEWGAPMRAQASMAMAASGTIGMYKATKSPLPMPRLRKALAALPTSACNWR